MRDGSNVIGSGAAPLNALRQPFETVIARPVAQFHIESNRAHLSPRPVYSPRYRTCRPCLAHRQEARAVHFPPTHTQNILYKFSTGFPTAIRAGQCLRQRPGPVAAARYLAARWRPVSGFASRAPLQPQTALSEADFRLMPGFFRMVALWRDTRAAPAIPSPLTQCRQKPVFILNACFMERMEARRAS